MKKILFCLLLSVWFFSCDNSHYKKEGNTEIYRFESSFFSPDEVIPMIRVKLGEDKGRNMVIDTGSVINILNESYYNKHKNDYTVIDSVCTPITTINGTTENEVTYVVKGYINDSIPVEYYIMDISSPLEAIFITQKIQVEGLLGVKFLRKNKIKIDFQNKTVTKHCYDAI